MKPALLPLLACPACRGEFTLTVFEETKGEIDPVREGLLACKICSRSFPVIRGIPRFVANVYSLFPDFLKRHAEVLPQGFADREFQEAQKATQERFSFQWMRYPGALREDQEVFLNETQIPAEEWKESLILDAGCGMGRYSRVAHHLGAQVVAVDLGSALIRLQDLASSSEKMHLIQGDLMQPPLKENIFDIVYSVGVIHHTPSAGQTFVELARLVKPEGKLSVWVYGAPGSFHHFRTNPLRMGREGLGNMIFLVWLIVSLREFLSDTLRKFTVKMPHSLLYLLCYPLAFLGKFPLIKYLTFSVHPLWRVRLQENFDWLSPPYQSHHTKEELRQWFEENHFEALKVLPHGFVPKPGILGRKIS